MGKVKIIMGLLLVCGMLMGGCKKNTTTKPQGTTKTVQPADNTKKETPKKAEETTETKAESSESGK